MTTIAWINNETNICDNVSYDDRPASEISIPGYQMIDLGQTPTVNWNWDGTQFVMVEGGIGEGSIGCTYENGKLIQPKPADTMEVPNQPVTSGTQEI